MTAMRRYTTYDIRAGYLDSILEINRCLTGHRSIDDALAALSTVMPAGMYVEGRDEDGCLVYTDREPADADQDGSSARASIVAVDRFRAIIDELCDLPDACSTGFAAHVQACLDDNPAVEAADVAQAWCDAADDYAADVAADGAQ